MSNPSPRARRRSGGSPLPLILLAAAGVLIAFAVVWLFLGGDPGADDPLGSGPSLPPESAPAPEVPAPEVAVEVPTPTVSSERWAERIDQLGTIKVRDLQSGELTTRAIHPLRGRVLNAADDSPVYYFWIHLVPEEYGEPLVAKANVSPSHFRNGEFAIDRQLEGTYHMVVESREHEPLVRRIQVPFDGELVVRLVQGSCIRGVVRDTSQTPLKDITIELGVVGVDEGHKPPIQRLVKTDGMGVYSFWKVPPGNYTLAANLSVTRLAEEREFRLDPGGSVTRDFTLERMGSIRVVLTNVAEQPIVRARVSLLREDESGRERPVRAVLSDLKGVARLDFVPDGSYKLRVQVQGFELHEQPLVVVASAGYREIPVQLQVAQRPGE